MLQDFFDQFQTASIMFAKFDLTALQNSVILQIFYCVRAQIPTCTSQLSIFDVSEKIPFGSNDIKEESAANSILITPRKNKEVLNAVNKMRRRLQCEGAGMDTFYLLKNNYKRNIFARLEFTVESFTDLALKNP